MATKRLTDDDYRKAAAWVHEDLGAMEFDDCPDVSRSKGGAYVACYIWVSAEEARASRHRSDTEGR